MASNSGSDWLAMADADAVAAMATLKENINKNWTKNNKSTDVKCGKKKNNEG